MAYNNSILSEVYNYYQTSLTPRPSNRFDAHKKSELKNVYHSIVNQSKEEPVYLFSRSSDIEKYTISMKESAMAFQHNMASLGGLDGNNLFKQRSVYSSDPQAIEAQYLNDDAKVFDEIEPYNIIVESTAKPQINRGSYLPPDDMQLDPGEYSFDINTSQSNYELQFSIGENDTNYDVQTRLARLINNSGIGLNASISTNGSGFTAISISSSSAGATADNRILFEINDEDTSQTSGVVNYLGIGNVSQESSWAKYSINGESFTSVDNSINIDNIFSANLLKAGGSEEQPIVIGTKPDYESLKDSIVSIAGSYNNFIKTASEYLEKQPRTTVLIDSMKRMTGYFSGTFNSLGLGQADDGTIEIDDDALSSALKFDADENTIDSMKKFTKSALRKISQVQLNPMDYVDKRIVAYKNPYKTHFPNPYITSAYSGMLFNGYM